MSDSILNVRIPQPSEPFLTADGGISRSWLYYMIGILERTGGNQGISAAILQKQILSLFVEEAMQGEQPAALQVPIAMSDVMSDDVPPVPIASSILFSMSAQDDAASKTINPFLASLLVADPV